MKKAYLELVRQIRDAVREKAQEVPIFRDIGNGCVRILAYPCCQEADEWLGGLSDFVHDNRFSLPPSFDIADYEHAFAITPGGSRVTSVDGRWADHYALSAMKIAHCSYSQDACNCLLSGGVKAPSLKESNGYAPYPGALCVEIQTLKTDAKGRYIGKPSDFCGIYVCVSGASFKEDLECAFVAIKLIREFFEDEEHSDGIFVINAPLFPIVGVGE